jgi:carbonic anhydrase
LDNNFKYLSATSTGFNLWGDGVGSKTPYIMGGGLTAKYNLVNFHFHWGSNDHNGSEHQLDSAAYAMEVRKYNFIS